MWPERYSRAKQKGPKHNAKGVCFDPKSTRKPLKAFKFRKWMEKPRTKDDARI